MHKGSVYASFGAEDGLQLLQMVAEGSRYESVSIYIAVLAPATTVNSSLIMHQLGNALDKE